MTYKCTKLVSHKTPEIDVDCAIILAGGLGTRLRTAVATVPKSMAPIDGRPFLEHQMDYWITQGITRIILSVGYLHDAICDHFGDHYKTASICYSIEETPLGTGGGLLQAARLTSGTGDILVLNGDSLFEVKLSHLVQFHRDKGSEWTLALFPSVLSPRHPGVTVNYDGRIIQMQVNSGPSNSLANGGAYIVRLELLANQACVNREPASLEADILPNLIASRHRIFGIAFDAMFIDIGIPEDYLRADSMIRTRRQVSA